jgi:elongation factor 2
MLFTMMDAPGHIEYSPEVAAALRMGDGTMNVVDVTSGVSVGHEYMLADSIKEKLKPCLFVRGY